jgi:hypothetical protein
MPLAGVWPALRSGENQLELVQQTRVERDVFRPDVCLASCVRKSPSRRCVLTINSASCGRTSRKPAG